LSPGTYFQLLGVPATMGRTIGENDDNSEGTISVAVVSYAGGHEAWRAIRGSSGQNLRIGSTFSPSSVLRRRIPLAPR